MRITLDLVSLSQEDVPAWWRRKSYKEQQAYLARHKRSRMKLYQKPPGAPGEPEEDDDKPSGSGKSVSFEDLNKQYRDKVPLDKRDKKIKRKSTGGLPISGGLIAVINEKLARKEEDRRAESMLPDVKSRLAKGVLALANNIRGATEYISQRLSPENIKALGNYIDAKKEGRVTEEHQRGKYLAHKITFYATKTLLGTAAVGAVAAGLAPVAGALAGAFFGYKDPSEALEGTGQLDEVADPDMVSESNDTENDPVSVMLDEFVLWAGNQDLDGIAERVARFQAIYQMQEEGWKPDTSQYSQEDLDEVLAAAQQENEEETGDEESDDVESDEMVSESAVRPRLSFKVNSTMARLPLAQRTRYDIRFNDRIIGTLDTNGNKGGFNRRAWHILLRDGFDESAFHSGRIENQPYTLVRESGVQLIHPVPMTFNECCSWVRANVEKKFL